MTDGRGTTQSLQHFIDGSWRSSTDDTGVSTDPSDPTGAPVATFPEAAPADIDAAVDAAARASADWRAMPLPARGNVLRGVATALERRADDIALLMAREQGKTVPEAAGEVGATIDTFAYHAASARMPDGTTYPSSHPEETIRSVRVPVGVVGVITPWNFPLQIPAWKIAPAILHGNTVVWKPASLTPAVACALIHAMVDAGVPAGVVNLVLGGGDVGARIVADPRVDAVTFTGSVPVGESIRDIAVPRGARLQMELGGHNAAIVLDDADLPSAADAIVAAITGGSGQKCTATRRVIVTRTAYEPLVDALATRLADLQVGPASDPASQVGPLVSEAAACDVNDAVREAVESGAEVLARSARVADGPAYVSPTLLRADATSRLCQEEVFGPVATIHPVDDLAAAIRLANATEYGLTASVFTCDERAVRRCLAELDAGLIKVNAPSTGSELHAPFGGLKASTFPAPREQNGEAAREFFTVTKTAYLRLPPDVAP